MCLTLHPLNEGSHRCQGGEKVEKSSASSQIKGLNIALWCNGSTSDSGSACEGSNPSKATQRKS